ncbi:ATP-binding protein [Halomonadaceae bacterium KBTZ08]
MPRSVIRKWLTTVLVFTLLIASAELIVWQFWKNQRANMGRTLVSQSSDARALLEAEISEGIYITVGLESFIQGYGGNPEFSALQRWMAALFDHTDHLRNIGIAPDNRITAVFPKEGNEAVLGVHYRDLPEQWPAVKRIMKEGKATFVGPLELAQGGTGLIYRRPVSVDGSYWGLISTVMELDSILAVLEQFDQQHESKLLIENRVPAQPETITGQLATGPRVSRSQTISFTDDFRWRLTLSQTVETWPFWLMRAGIWTLGLVIWFAIWQWFRYQRLTREMEMRKAREKIDFMHSVSHELRTPLTSVSGAVSLLERTQAQHDPKASHLLDLAARNLKRMQHLLDDVLDLARLDSSRMTFDPEKVALSPLIRQAIENNQFPATTDDINLTYSEPESGEQIMVWVDQKRFMQVMDNLLSNAIKFSDPGQTVQVAAASEGNQVAIHVQDEGAGIPDDFQNRLFERFTRADETDKRRHQSGTGLGLSIALELVSRMGGEIHVSSREGMGSCFTVKLPRAGMGPS